MTGLNRSVMMYHRLLALSFLMVTTVFFATSCKSSKKKSTAGGGAPPTTSLEGDLTGSNCAAELTTVAPLPSASLTSLNLTSADVENVSLGGFKTAKIVLNLADGSGRPDRCIYYACSAKDKSQCVLGSSASCQDFNPDLPAGAINLTAWACVRPERVEGYPGSLSNYEKRKVMVGQETFYCGNPVTHYDNKDKNSYESDSIAQIQSLLKTLEDRRIQFGTNIVNIVKQYVANHQSTGDSTDATWINIANLGDLSGETIALLYADAKSAASDAQGQLGNVSTGAGLTALGLNLSNSGEPCIPLPDPNTISNTTSGFSPPSPVTIPDTPVVNASTDDLGGTSGSETTDPGTSTTPNSDTGTTPTVAAADYEAKCNQRSEWFQSQNLGSTVWNKELNRCFHVKADGKQTEIDVSIDPDQLASNDGDFEEVQVTDEETGMSGWQKTGAVMMAIGGVMGVAGAASYYYYGKGPGSKSKSPSGTGTVPSTTVQKTDDVVDLLKSKQLANMSDSKSVWNALNQEIVLKQQAIDTGKVDPSTKFKGTGNEFSWSSQYRFTSGTGGKFFAIGPGNLTIDPSSDKVSIDVWDEDSGAKKQVDLDNPKAKASAQKLQTSIDNLNFRHSQLYDANKTIAAGSEVDPGSRHAPYQKYLDDVQKFSALGMPDDPTLRQNFASVLDGPDKVEYQRFLQTEAEWRQKEFEFKKAQTDFDLSHRIFHVEHVSRAPALGLNAHHTALDDSLSKLKQNQKLVAELDTFKSSVVDLQYRENIRLKYEDSVSRGLDVGVQQRYKAELDRVNLEWDTRLKPPVQSVDVDTGSTSKGSYWEKLKSGDAPTRADAGMKGGLLGAAMFAVGGLMASGVLGLTQGSNLTQSITSDPNYIRNINDLEMINSLIEGLRRSSSFEVVNGSNP